MIALIALMLGQAARLEPLDVVRVQCDEVPALARDYTLSREGVFAFGPVGSVSAAGLTEPELASRLEQLLAARGVRSSVSVQRVGSSRRTVSFTGDVKQSGEIPWKAGMRLSDIVAVARPNQNALARVSIRSSEGSESVWDILSGKLDPLLKPGDRIHFPLDALPRRVLVVGAVKRPGEIDLSDAGTVAAAIAAAGGPLPDADLGNLEIRRGNKKQTASRTEPLEGGDVLKVATLPANRLVEARGAVLRPGKLPSEGETLSGLLRKTGTSSIANLKAVHLTRIEGSRVTTSTYDLTKIRAGKAKDVPLKGGDVVEVEYRVRVS